MYGSPPRSKVESLRSFGSPGLSIIGSPTHERNISHTQSRVPTSQELDSEGDSEHSDDEDIDFDTQEFFPKDDVDSEFDDIVNALVHLKEPEGSEEEYCKIIDEVDTILESIKEENEAENKDEDVAKILGQLKNNSGSVASSSLRAGSIIKDVVNPIIDDVTKRISKPVIRYDPSQSTSKKRDLINKSTPTSKRGKMSNSVLSVILSEFSNFSAVGACLKATRGARCENTSPNGQAKRIHGKYFDAIKSDRNAKCALCGFAFSDRQPTDYDSTNLAMSYDHFIPVNFAATILRTVTSKSEYSQKELEIMSHLGEMVCYPCNYLKSQMRFITCPDGPTELNWNSLQPNEVVIQEFIDKLPSYKISKHNGYNQETNTRSFDRALEASNMKLKDWKEERFKVIKNKAQYVCNIIKENVDFDKAFKRVKLAKSILRKFNVDKSITNPKRARAKALLVALSNYEEKPWKDPTISKGENLSGGNFPFDIGNSKIPIVNAKRATTAKRNKIAKRAKTAKTAKRAKRAKRAKTAKKHRKGDGGRKTRSKKRG